MAAERILVIKLSALGDFVLGLGPMQAIRRAHPAAELTLLTTKPFAGLAEASGMFQRVWVDERAKLWQPGAVLGLRRRLAESGFARIYDLQTSNRTLWYFRMMWPAGRGGRLPEWSGHAPGCSHPHRDAARDRLHQFDSQSGQLADAGVADVRLSDLSWWQSDVARLDLPERYAVLLPGGAAHRPEKRWPADRFGAVARRLIGEGLVPVVVGGPPEAEAAAAILAACPEARSLVGETSLMDLAPVMRGSRLVLGNDTGPMHVAALVGRPCVVMFGPGSRPALSRPRAHPGYPEPIVLEAPDLADLPEERVWNAVSDILRAPDPLPLQ